MEVKKEERKDDGSIFESGKQIKNVNLYCKSENGLVGDTNIN